MKQFRQPQCKRSVSQGQGVVEYAGALVIAMVIVGMGIASVPDAAYSFFGTVQEGVLQYIVDEGSALLGG